MPAERAMELNVIRKGGQLKIFEIFKDTFNQVLFVQTPIYYSQHIQPILSSAQKENGNNLC